MTNNLQSLFNSSQVIEDVYAKSLVGLIFIQIGTLAPGLRWTSGDLSAPSQHRAIFERGRRRLEAAALGEDGLEDGAAIEYEHNLFVMGATVGSCEFMIAVLFCSAYEGNSSRGNAQDVIYLFSTAEPDPHKALRSSLAYGKLAYHKVK